MNEYFNYIGIFLLIGSSFISLFFFLVIGKIHIKDKFLQQGFFKVVFTIVILEILLRLILIISPFLILFIHDKEEIMRKIIYFSFNFVYMTILFFNLITVSFLYLDKSEDLISKDINDKKAHRDSVRVNNYSFNCVSIVSFLFGFIHTIILNVFETYINGNYEQLTFFPIKFNDKDNIKKLYEIIIYIPNFIFFIVSFLYLKLSWNKEKITDNIVIKSYALYCFHLSFFYLNYPIIILIDSLFNRFNYDRDIIILLSNLCLMIQNIFSSKYRMKCIYIESIFEGKKISFSQKIIKLFKILFTNEGINRLNSVDYNNSFIIFSLSSKEDFINEIERNTTIYI